MKRITANFDTIDKATFALKNIKMRSKGMKSATVKYKTNHSEYEEAPAVCSDFFVPMSSSSGIYQSEPFLQTFNLAAISEKKARQELVTEHKTASVSLEVSDAEAKKIASILRYGGGYEVKTADI